ncbi:MAG: hypothetical protein ABSB50_11490 [Terracidiphilus sp.]|jgi:hypothetical protein
MKHRQLEEVAQPAFKRTARVKARFLRFIDVNAGARVSWKIVLLWGEELNLIESESRMASQE